MLSIFRALLTVFFAFTMLTNCSTSQKDAKSEMDATSDKKGPTVNPHYIITVMQGTQNFGDIELELMPDIAPKTVHNFDSLVAAKFFDGTAFHRVIPGFMIQGGDPNSKDKPKETWGMGDRSQTRVPAEFNKLKHERGVISMARSSDPNSATSQFFICHAAAPFLDGQYTGFGKVVSGIEVVDKVCTVKTEGRENSSPVEKITMTIKKK